MALVQVRRHRARRRQILELASSRAGEMTGSPAAYASSVNDASSVRLHSSSNLSCCKYNPFCFYCTNNVF
jgi:hypothetical protein